MPFVGLGLSLSNEDHLAATVTLAQRADALGFDEVSIPESRQHRAVFSAAAATLARTNSIRVRIGIANPLTRHPSVLAMEAATLAEIAGPERVRFGIGAAEWTMKALGYAPDGWRPYTHTVEAVRAVRRWLDGHDLGFTPTTFVAPSTSRLDFVPEGPVAIDVGAVNARMMRAAGEFADGVQLGAITSPAYTAWACRHLATGAARSGRSVGDLLVSANVLTSVGRDRAEARDAVRRVLSYYLWRVEGVVVAESGADPEAVAAVRKAMETAGPAAAAANVSDHLIDTFAVAGTVDDVVTGLGRFADAGLQLPLAWYTFGPDKEWALQALAGDVAPAVCQR
jgi:alkanesulfonate monooxygenase SsuD/methylene tetrahydromethanopterin reductase-like flavin-dependent oxidoreductase (luciferase family)